MLARFSLLIRPDPRIILIFWGFRVNAGPHWWYGRNTSK
jgi:hypothetical protein